MASSINLGKAVSDTAFLKFVKVVYQLAIADFLNHTIINHWLNYTVEKAVSDRVALPHPIPADICRYYFTLNHKGFRLTVSQYFIYLKS